MLRALVIAVFMVFIIPLTVLAKPVLVSSGEYPPYTGEKLPHGGFVNHVITAALNASGYDVKITYYPWARAFELAKIGSADVVSYIYKTERRESDYWLSAPITRERLVIFSKKGTEIPKWRSLSDFKELRIGITRGFSYTDELWDLAQRDVLHLDYASSDYSNFAKLIEQRIDIFFADEVTGYTTLRSKFAPGFVDSIKSSDRAVAEHVGVLGFTKKREAGQELRDAFNSGLNQLKDSGEFEKMFNALVEGKYSHPSGSMHPAQ